jgi:hypothetical protein
VESIHGNGVEVDACGWFPIKTEASITLLMDMRSQKLLPINLSSQNNTLLMKFRLTVGFSSLWIQLSLSASKTLEAQDLVAKIVARDTLAEPIKNVDMVEYHHIDNIPREKVGDLRVPFGAQSTPNIEKCRTKTRTIFSDPR